MSNLSPEQKSVLGAVFHFLDSSTIYLRAVAPVASETDERMIKGMIELAEICMKRLAEYFPELRPLAEERKNRAGGAA